MNLFCNVDTKMQYMCVYFQCVTTFKPFVWVCVPQWFPLKDTKTGRVHLRLEWLTLMNNTDKLEEVRELMLLLINMLLRVETEDPFLFVTFSQLTLK